MVVSTGWLKNQMFTPSPERTNIDAILSRRDIEKMENLFKKNIWEKEDLQTLMHLLAGAETKMLNFSSHDRIILAKFLAWIEDFVTTGIQAYDIKERMEEQENLTEGEQDILNKAVELTIHTIRYLTAIFLFLSRSSLSLDAEAFSRFTEQRVVNISPQLENPPQKKKGLLGW